MGEMVHLYPQIEDRCQGWEEEFPGDALSVVALREDLNFADQQSRATRFRLQSFEQKVALTGKPMEAWPDRLIRYRQLLKREYKSDNALFQKSLSALQTQVVNKANEPPKKQASKPEPKGHLDQFVKVKVIDGQTVSTLNPTAEAVLKNSLKALDVCSSWWRNYCFEDGIVPKEYEFTLEDEGNRYVPTENTFIQYSPKEFLRICQREVDSQSPHALDGERMNYHRMKDDKPIERPNHEENQNQEQEQKEDHPPRTVD